MVELHREGSAPAACAAGLYHRDSDNFQSVELNKLYNNVKQTVMVLRGKSMVRHYVGLNQINPDRRSCLTLSANDSVG